MSKSNDKHISIAQTSSDDLASADYYIDKKTGYMVFTEVYHLKRGYCCKNNCRHCPYKKK